MQMSKTQFHRVKVKQVDKTTSDCTVVTLDIPKELQDDFHFIQGQYLTLKTKINDEDVRRSYSLCSSPIDNEWKVGVKQIPGGKFSTFANQVLKGGDELEVMAPAGNFFVEVDPNQARKYVAFAAGSGITPMVSIIKTHLALEPNSTFKLFYINKNVGSIILKEELEALKNVYMERLEIFYFLTKEFRNVELFNGRLDEEKMDIIFKTICDVDDIDHYFMCGPEQMIFMVRDFLLQKQVDKDHIHFELFNTSGVVKKKIEVAPELKGEQTEVTILEGGKSFIYNIKTGEDNILDGALQNNADLPFACKGGVCCTCRAKVIEGEVEMRVNYALEEDEVAAGFVLTCQAVPKTKKVVVDFDY